MFSLAMSLFVAVTLVPVLCSKLLQLPPTMDQRKGLFGKMSYGARGRSEQDDAYRELPKALTNGRSSLPCADPWYGRPEVPPRPIHDADRRGTSQRQRGAGQETGSKSPIRTAADRGSGPSALPKQTTNCRPAGEAGISGRRRWRSGSRGKLKIMLRRDERRGERRFRPDLRRQLRAFRRVVRRANRRQSELNRLLSGGGKKALPPAAIRAKISRLEDLPRPLKNPRQPGCRVHLGRDEGRKELASASTGKPPARWSATTLRKQSHTRGTQAALFAIRKNPDLVRLRETSARTETTSISPRQTAGGVVMPASNYAD